MKANIKMVFVVGKVCLLTQTNGAFIEDNG